MGLKNKVATALLSDVGRIRNNNEDAVALDEELGLLLLSDGMGGYNAGEVASSISNDTILEVVRREVKKTDRIKENADHPYWPQTLLLEQAVRSAHELIYQTAQTQPNCAGMGTTVVAVWLHNDRMSIAHVGDSRLYRFRFGELKQITRDHSLQEEMIARGQYSRADAERLIKKNIVTRALGVEPEVAIELNERSVAVGDLLLLCSDGLSDIVGDENIRVCLRQYHGELDKAAEDLVRQALAAGGKDNVSVVLARIDRGFGRGNGLIARIAQLFR